MQYTIHMHRDSPLDKLAGAARAFQIENAYISYGYTVCILHYMHPVSCIHHRVVSEMHEISDLDRWDSCPEELVVGGDCSP